MSIKKFLSFLFIVLMFFSLGISPIFAEEDVVIVLDPGHGGSDCGSIGKLYGTTYYEKDLNDIVTAHLYDALAQYNGVKVYLTRYDDSMPSLQARSYTAANLKADLFISLHMNSLDNAAYWGGAEIYVHTGKYDSKAAATATTIAKDILAGFEKHGIKDRGVKTREITDDEYYLYPNGAYADYYGIIRFATSKNIPAMIIEHGFMSNEGNLNFLSKSENLKKLANESATSIAKYFNLEKGQGQKMTLKIQDNFYINDIPTTLTVGDEVSNLSAYGGSGAGDIHFESNDTDVIRVYDNKIVAVGAGKANIRAVRNADGEYQAKTSDNYIRITVNKAVTPTPTPTSTPTFTPSPTPTSTPMPTPVATPTISQQPISPEVSSSVHTDEPTTSVHTEWPTASSTGDISNNINNDTKDSFWNAIIIIGGIFAAFIIVSVILLIRSNSKKR